MYGNISAYLGVFLLLTCYLHLIPSLTPSDLKAPVSLSLLICVKKYESSLRCLKSRKLEIEIELN